jgi:dihydrofolate reductase
MDFVGGASLVTAFLNQNAIDEMMIFVIPTLSNEGIPLFTEITSKQSLELLDTTSYDN